MNDTQSLPYKPDNQAEFTCRIHNRKYLFRAAFLNADGSVAVEVMKSGIKELYLHDFIDNPFVSGYIVVDNRLDAFERSRINDKDVGYRVRGDARDVVLLTIIPLIGDDAYSESGFEHSKLFGFQYAFVITDEEDVGEGDEKVKKFTLEDLDKQMLQERNAFFTTSSFLSGDVTRLTDDQRAAYTGDIMKGILRNVLQDNFKVKQTNSLTPLFEQGSSKIFFSSPSHTTALEDLMYIYRLHVSNDDAHDFSFLLKDTFTGEYKLESASSLFKKAYDKTNDDGGELFLENLVITGIADQRDTNVIANDVKKPLKALEFGELSQIYSVKFINTPGERYQSSVNTQVVCGYDQATKLFAIDCVEGNIDNVKKDFTSYYVHPMKGKDGKPSPNFIVNRTQKTNQNYSIEFTPYSDFAEKLALSSGRNSALKQALLLNIGVELTVVGSFHRKAGTFISIDRVGDYVDNAFDNKFLGIYLIISVEHIMQGDIEYANKIIAVKTYHFTDPKIGEDIE